MTCNKRLSPWVIVRLLPNMRRVIVGRFRTRSDAVCEAWCVSSIGHWQALRRLLPTAEMVIMFDVEEG